MKNSLFSKIFKLVFFIILIIFAVSIYQFFTFQKDMLIKTLELKARNVAESFVIAKSDAMIVDDEIQILEFAQDFTKSTPQIKSFEIHRKNGNRLIIMKDGWHLVEKNDIKNQVIMNLNKYEIIDSTHIPEEVFRYTHAVYFSNLLWGNFKIELSLDDYNKQITQMYINSTILVMVLLLASFLISYFIAKMISKPIVQLTNISMQISDGDLTRRVNVDSTDEIGILAKNFNKMVENLENSQDELKKSHDDLEQRVAQRTQELKELNDNLELKVNQEIKKQQEQEQLLIQQSKLASMGEMIGNIAHQWRQPLNALGLVMQNIQFTYELDELDDDFMNKSVKKVNLLTKNMSKTIDDFGNFFKPNKEKEDFSLNDYVQKTLELIESTFEHNNIDIESCFNSDLRVYGFSNEYSQTLLNILNNAKDALLEKKPQVLKVKIKISNDDKYGIVNIIDNAGGIPEKIIERIFDPYFTTKDEGKGTGIGLYMSKIIIEKNMNGKLYVDNIPNGANFTIKIPLHKDLKC